MAEVQNHLVPTDGLTNSLIRFDSFEVVHGAGGANVKFGIYDEDAHWLADFVIFVSTDEGSGSVAGVIARAHRQMTDVLRQWLYMTDMLRQSYEKQAVQLSQHNAQK
jgi:hypothetical protein